jgi:parvulin-like peptidyl-prolyl isomerase
MGPVYSAYGGHLIKVSAHVDARLPELEEIRALVEREYLAERRKELKDLAYAKLREGYDVTIEPFASAQGAASGIIATAEADKAQ